MVDAVEVTDTTVTVPNIVIRALAGKWVPSARHGRMTHAELGAALGCSETDAARACDAVLARKLVIAGNADILAGTVNKTPKRIEEGREKLDRGAKLGAAALSGVLP